MTSPSTITQTSALIQCPACKRHITAETIYRVGSVEHASPADESPEKVPTSAWVELKLAGLRVSHDCTPGVTR